MSLQIIQEQVDQWIKQHGVRYFNELTNTAILMEEVGELARLVSRTYGEQSFKEGENKEGLGAELADIIFVCACLANQTGVDLSKAFEAKLKIKTERDLNRHKSNPKLKP